MKKAMVLMVLSASLVGCRDEATRFGYKGFDLQDDDELQYFTCNSAITNWVPTRVMLVSERYELSADETNLITRFGFVDPGSTLKQVPAGYRERDREPWFSAWVKESTVGGFSGVVGFVCHHDPDCQTWQTGESFFSTYHATQEAAKDALQQLKKFVRGEFHPLKIYEFPDSLVFEYRRLRVIAAVGERNENGFPCMLNVVDKNCEGCGAWLPIDEQQTMLDDWLFGKKVQAWNAECRRQAFASHQQVLAACASRKWRLFGCEPSGRSVWKNAGSAGFVGERSETMDALGEDDSQEALVAERLKSVAGDFGLVFSPCETNGMADGVIWSAVGTNEFFSADCMFQFQTNAAPVQMFLRITEKPLPEFAMPAYPSRKQHRK